MHAPTVHPSSWVRRFAPLVPPGEVLDLACGSGRHARLFAQLGHPVLAVARDPQALQAAA
ncbi:MAG TPA: SAM-dependent methyltransferase, partial [Massilia sp.]|nr:SAM-dependent methyltransferase [Massilia sp.]